MECEPSEGTSREFGIMILDDSLTEDPEIDGTQDSMSVRKEYSAVFQPDDEMLVVPCGSPGSFCRLCFSEVNVEPLTMPSVVEQPKQFLIDLVRRYLDIRLDPTRSYAICVECRMMLEEFDYFRERCMRCDSLLIRGNRHGKASNGVVGQANLNCSHCSRTFQTQHSLSLHLKNFHGSFGGAESGMLECVHCTRIFVTEGHLKLHVRSMHDPVGTTFIEVQPPEDASATIFNSPEPDRPVSFTRSKTPLEVTNNNESLLIPIANNSRVVPTNAKINMKSCSIRLKRLDSSIYESIKNPVIPTNAKISMKPCSIQLERLDSSIPSIKNFEISLGKFFYIRQQKALSQQFYDDDEDLRRNYPGFVKTVRKFSSQPCSNKRRKATNSSIRCDLCQQQFLSQGSLTRHMYSHTYDYPHPCGECPLGFTRPKLLEEHRNRYHGPGGQSLFLAICPYCARPFTSPKSVSIHVELNHPEQMSLYREADDVRMELWKKVKRER